MHEARKEEDMYYTAAAHVHHVEVRHVNGPDFATAADGGSL